MERAQPFAKVETLTPYYLLLITYYERQAVLFISLQHRVKTIEDKTQGLFPTDIPSIACIEWTEPLMSAAYWILELVTSAGGLQLL